MLCFGLLAYSLLSGLQEAAVNYDAVYATETARELEDLFLFIPPSKIARIARVGALLVFMTFFLLFSEITTGGGILRGLFLATCGASVVLMLPRMIIRFLRGRRLQKFNEQLVEALVSMSNALKAGFSITQAVQTVQKEYPAPISQEFGVFLQQVRLGVSFEAAMENLDERVGSEDLTLMIRSVEIARQTGGNLTEVFEKIAEVIRERMRIEGKIRSLTAMGKLQGIVVGFMPVLLLVALTLLDPEMMARFYANPAGIGIIVGVIILEIIGFLVIRKITTIEV